MKEHDEHDRRVAMTGAGRATRRLRVLHVLGDRQLPRIPEDAAMSGVVRAVLEIARAQAFNGNEVWVAAVGRSAWQERWHGVRLVSMRPAPWARLTLGGRTLDAGTHLPFVALAARHRFDVAHGHIYDYLRFIRAGCRIMYCHADPAELGPGDARRIRLDTDTQVAVSHFIARSLGNVLGLDGQVHTVHNGIDLDLFDPARHGADRAELRARWQAADGDVVFLYPGAIVPKKGVVHLVRAFARLARRHPRVHLVLAGAGSLWGSGASSPADVPADYEQEVRRAVDDVPEGRVHFLGKRTATEMPGVYVASDVVVVPSVWNEPFPLVAGEALASGRPVIASRVGGLPEIVTRANGVLVEAGNEAELLAAMAKLVSDEDYRAELTSAARGSVRQFTWAATAAALDHVYDAVLEGLPA